MTTTNTRARQEDTDVKGLGRDEASMPDPEHDAKPDGPTDLHKRSWKYIGRKVMREFSRDQLTDQAAALTYYAVLAIFPALLALISVLGVVGQSGAAVDTVLDILRPLVAPSTIEAIDEPIRNLADSQGAGIALVTGLLGALWSASGYVGAFGRAMNRIYEIDEGRPFWKLRPVMLTITLVAVLMAALVLVMLVVSGPVAESIGRTLGIGDTAVQVWDIAKWPVIAVVVVMAVALLYYATPNIQQPKFRWISVGAGVAILIWVIASVGFAFYVSNFGSYDRTYGSLAGVIVTLLWLWITNLALMLGAEIDAELERGRELQAGLPAEKELQLPARDTRNIEKAQQKQEEDIELGRRIREQAADDTDDSDSAVSESEVADGDQAESGGVPSQGRHRAEPITSTLGETVPAGVEADRGGRMPMYAAGAAGFALGTTFGRMTRKETE